MHFKIIFEYFVYILHFNFRCGIIALISYEEVKFVMSTMNQKVLARLLKAEEDARKPLSIPFKIENIKHLDTIAKAMTQHSGITTTRNMLIEDAVECFIEEAVNILEAENIELEIETKGDFDCIVFPAQMGEEYQQAFFNEHEWRFVRVAKNKIAKIKYIALYVGAPQSAITHYAKVAPNGFVYDEIEKKYRIRLDGDPIELPNPIPRGSISPVAVRSPKYTTLNKLFVSNEFKELYLPD